MLLRPAILGGHVLSKPLASRYNAASWYNAAGTICHPDKDNLCYNLGETGRFL